MGLLEKFRESISSLIQAPDGGRMLLAVSGGIDSIVLCELCKQSGYDFAIAHCNFQLRGQESERDEQFVRKLGKKYDVEVLVKKFDTDTYAAQHKTSIQVAARELRYEWFGQLIESGKADYILTAHHADDNAETVAMNFFRGTGLHGLTGMPAVAGPLRRPLLEFSRQSIIDFARDHDLAYVEDSSNQSSKYTRNLFRNEIIPLVEKAYKEARQNLQDNIGRFREIEKLYQVAVGEMKKKLWRKKGDEIHIPIKQLLGFNNRALIFEIISEFGFTEKQVEEVLKLAGTESGKFIQSPRDTYRLIRHRHWLIISPAKSPAASTIVIEENEASVPFAGGTLQIHVIPASPVEPKTPQNIASFDAGAIHFPLLLREWKQGDYFYPLGMKKKKKLARFFIDQKLSKTEKEKVWVLEMNKKIIWIVGHRIDDRFKVTGKTRSILRITSQPS